MRARGKVGLYFITGIKETQNGTRAAPTRARITSTLTHTANQRCGQPLGRSEPPRGQPASVSSVIVHYNPRNPNKKTSTPWSVS